MREDERAGVETTIATWFAAWSDMPAGERERRLSTCLADDATYTDRLVSLTGRDEIAAFVEEFVARRPGARFEILGPVRHHDHVSLVEWRYAAADGAAILDGFEFEESAEDGRIRRAVAFWEPPTGRPGTS